MVGLDQKTIEKLSTPIIKVLRGNRGKDGRSELCVKCYTCYTIINREKFLKELKQYGEVNIVDWNYLTLFEIKGIDPFDLQDLICLIKKTLTLN